MLMKNPTRLRLAEVLAELGWTQKELAERSGLSENAISNLIRQPQSIRFETLDAISRATGKPVSELLAQE